MVPHCITLGRPGIGSRFSRKDVWSALQTHLQGLDGATLAVVPEKCHHVQPPFLEFKLRATFSIEAGNFQRGIAGSIGTDVSVNSCPGQYCCEMHRSWCTARSESVSACHCVPPPDPL